MARKHPERRSRARSEAELTRREQAVGWGLFGLALIGAAGLGALLLLAVPLIVIAFPLTLAAVAIILAIGWWRRRRASGVAPAGPTWHQRSDEQGDDR